MALGLAIAVATYVRTMAILVVPAICIARWLERRRGDPVATPAPDAVGSTSVRVITRDSGGTENDGVDTDGPDGELFKITINPVNDQPTLALAGDRVINEDQDPAPQTVVGFATPDAGGGPDGAEGRSVDVRGRRRSRRARAAPSTPRKDPPCPVPHSCRRRR